MSLLAALLQTLAVGAIVSACAVYAAWSLLPASVRRRVATMLARRVPVVAGWAPFAKVLGSAAGACGGGCDGCSGAAASGANAVRGAKGRRVIPVIVEPRR